jgi:hypothetical protein
VQTVHTRSSGMQIRQVGPLEAQNLSTESVSSPAPRAGQFSFSSALATQRSPILKLSGSSRPPGVPFPLRPGLRAGHSSPPAPRAVIPRRERREPQHCHRPVTTVTIAVMSPAPHRTACSFPMTSSHQSRLEGRETRSGSPRPPATHRGPHLLAPPLPPAPPPESPGRAASRRNWVPPPLQTHVVTVRSQAPRPALHWEPPAGVCHPASRGIWMSIFRNITETPKGKDSPHPNLTGLRVESLAFGPHPLAHRHLPCEPTFPTGNLAIMPSAATNQKKGLQHLA